MMNLKDIKSTINMHYSEMYEINELKKEDFISIVKLMMK